jgi:uncharacterized membrane protein
MADDQRDEITGIKPYVLNAALSYVGILVLLPLMSGAAQHPFVTFHAKQGLVIFAGEILAILLSYWLSYVGGLLFVVMLLASLAGILSSLREDKWYIPGISTIANLFTL